MINKVITIAWPRSDALIVTGYMKYKPAEAINPRRPINNGTNPINTINPWVKIFICLPKRSPGFKVRYMKNPMRNNEIMEMANNAAEIH